MNNLKKQYKQAFDNSLAATDPLFQSWYRNNTLEGMRGVPYDDNQAYDYYSFYRNWEYKNPEYGIEKHFPDTYKRPSHPTFSNESIYSTPENPGGQWGGPDGETYNPKGKFQYNPMKKQYYHGGKMYFLGSDLSFTDYMKNNPAGISAIGAAGANQQLQPMGQAQSATLQLAPNNHAGATSNDPSVSPSGKGVLNAVMPGAGEILGAVSGTTNSLVNMFDKPGGSMVGAAIKGAMSGNPFGAPLAMMQLRQQRKEEQRLYNQASLANYASGTQAINPMMHTYTAAHGGFISPITEFNGGGTHEENPLGGIPQGYNRDNGAPNLVESRETKSNIKNVYSHHPEAKPTKNYIFSDRGVLEDPKAFGLGGNLAGKTFADAHKKLSALAKERPFDKLANDTLAINTGRLKDANDAMIAEKDFEASNPAEKISHYNQKDRLGSRSIFKYGGFIFKDF